MQTHLPPLFALIVPLAFALIAFCSRFKKTSHHKFMKKGTLIVSSLGMIIAAISGFFVFQYGTLTNDVVNYNGLGIGVRLDALSCLMFGMISILGFIVLKFSSTYLDGDDRHGTFLGRLAATISAVLLFVLSGNLLLLFVSWVCTSLCLHKLLTFYADRPRAITAAKKKFIVARIGDLALLIAFVLIYFQLGTGDLEEIFAQIGVLHSQSTYPVSIEIAAMFIAIAAILKSALFPTHGWLIEVMETPTPVSALLHAGLLNAGPFLVTRMAFVMEGTTYSAILLIVFGGLTALFASTVYLTQTSVKTALGYSSVAHMGFMLLVCGMGVYPAAMLHLVAHSFYKAHAFLSSGSVIDVVRANKVSIPMRLGSPVRIIGSIAIAIGIYTALALAWGISPVENMPLFATGAIIIMGLSQIIAPTIDAAGGAMAMLKASFLAIMVGLAFFTLEGTTEHLLYSQIPIVGQPSIIISALIIFTLTIYAIVVIAQIIAPAKSSNSFTRKMGVHFRNGWYLNALFDRMVGSLYIKEEMNATYKASAQPNAVPLTH